MESQKFVFTDGEIEPQIRAIVQKSKKQVILVTPYLDLWGHLKNEIAKAVKRKIRVQVIVRPEEKEDKKRTDALEWLVENEVEVYELERLHAKIYMNEKNLLVSSMNLTESSTTNSLEIAMIVCDLNTSETLRKYASNLLENARRIDVQNDQNYAPANQPEDRLGECIRCSRRIEFEPERPLCKDCYELWNQYGREDYPEHFCHSCGKRAEVSKGKPLCWDCYQKINPD